jgi:hypothetical protein
MVNIDVEFEYLHIVFDGNDEESIIKQIFKDANFKIVKAYKYKSIKLDGV